MYDKRKEVDISTTERVDEPSDIDGCLSSRWPG